YGVGIGPGSLTGTLIGGTQPGAGNLISGNTASGVQIHGSGATVQGNFIGTDVTGTKAIGNGFRVFPGILIYGDGNTIGGTAPEARNVISGNIFEGVSVVGSSATGNLVQGNFIGTQADATSSLGNGRSGVVIDDSASNNVIGGADDGAGNIIAFNGTA